MSLNIVDFDVLEYLDVSAIQLILVITVALCSVFFAFDWIKKSFRNLPPGPRGLPLLGYLPFLGKEPHKTLTELGKKYGNIFGLYLGRNYTVILTDYNAVKEILCHPSTFNRPSGFFDFVGGGLGFGTVNGAEWQEQRRFCMQAMRNLGLGKGPWETLIQEEVLDFRDELINQKGRPFEMTHLLTSSVNCNIMSLLIGRKLEKRKENDNIQIITSFAEACLKYVGPAEPATILPWFRKYLELFKIAGYHKSLRTISKFCDFLGNEVRKHQSSKELKHVKDFINIYLDEMYKKSTEREDHYFSIKNLEGNLRLLFLGAGDTIISSLRWLIRLMAAYPDIQRKVQAELDDVVGREGRACYEDRSKFPYTFSVMMESQRYSSILPLNSLRSVDEDIKTKDFTIPKGSHVIAITWALHNDPNYWKQPQKFLPERFLPDVKKNVLKPESFNTFSVGKRNCPGETVAWMEIFLYFTTIMQRFTVKVPEGSKVNYDVDYGLVCHLKPQKLCFIERE